MSAGDHECPRCGKEWNCDGCHTRLTRRLCDACEAASVTAPDHLLSRVVNRDDDLRNALAPMTRAPTDLRNAIVNALEARLDVLRAEMGLPTSDEQANASVPPSALAAVQAFQREAAHSIRGMASMRPDLAQTCELLARMIEGFPAEEYATGERS